MMLFHTGSIMHNLLLVIKSPESNFEYETRRYSQLILRRYVESPHQAMARACIERGFSQAFP